MNSFLSSFLFFFLLTILSNGVCEEDLSLVQTKQGTVQGISLNSRENQKYYGWLGVLFGKVEERFGIGQPAEPWDGVKEVKTLPPVCFQYFVFAQEMMGVEDCLQLNVYSKNPKVDKKLPVMLFLSPGGFQIGGASLFEAKYIMDQEVVFVSTNFRLGALGFLNTGDGTVEGNMGLKDVVLALKWVQENIGNFGGDPNLVTVFGLSAGAAAVEYLTISEMAKGLFHRGIALSGSALNPWAFQANPVSYAEALAQAANCSETGWNWSEKVSCLRTKEPEDVINAQLKLMKLGFEYDFILMKFVPSVESDVVESPFLKDTPYNLLSSGEIANKVPMIWGHTENEGALYAAKIINDPNLIQKVESSWNSMAPHLFYYEDSAAPEKLDRVSKALRDFYLFGRPLSAATKKGFTDIYSDRFFCNGIGKGIQMHSKYQEVYPYILAYQGEHSLVQSHFDVGKDGVGHADDLMYLFNEVVGSPEIKLGTRDGQFSEKLLKLFITFARDGKPTETWGPQKEWAPQSPEVKREGRFSTIPINYYKLDLEATEMLDDPLSPRRYFWDTLPLREHDKADLDGGKVKQEL